MKIIIGSRVFDLLEMPGRASPTLGGWISDLWDTRTACGFGGFLYQMEAPAVVGEGIAGLLDEIVRTDIHITRDEILRARRTANKLRRLASKERNRGTTS